MGLGERGDDICERHRERQGREGTRNKGLCAFQCMFVCKYISRILCSCVVCASMFVALGWGSSLLLFNYTAQLHGGTCSLTRILLCAANPPSPFSSVSYAPSSSSSASLSSYLLGPDSQTNTNLHQQPSSHTHTHTPSHTMLSLLHPIPSVVSAPVSRLSLPSASSCSSSRRTISQNTLSTANEKIPLATASTGNHIVCPALFSF